MLLGVAAISTARPFCLSFQFSKRKKAKEKQLSTADLFRCFLVPESIYSVDTQVKKPKSGAICLLLLCF